VRDPSDAAPDCVVRTAFTTTFADSREVDEMEGRVVNHSHVTSQQEYRG
jgi:hypothetical protein